MPLYLSVVLGTSCNLDCPFCYQVRTDENLLGSDPFGIHLRRELTAFYPYLSTLRIGGGEVFVIPGFGELVDEIESLVKRPIISIATNGTLIDQEWAEKIVSIPFQEVTVSIDGALPETYARLRRGASLGTVLTNIDRIQSLKEQRKTRFPDVNFFFLMMRCNYREIPAFLQMAKDHGIDQVSIQIPVVDQRNLCREPGLAAEVDFNQEEVAELHDLAGSSIKEHRREFKAINLSGLHSLFQKHNLDADFLAEDRFSIYPGDSRNNKQSTDQAAEQAAVEAEKIRLDEAQETAVCNQIRLCPNPWTLMFITEDGNVQLCSGLPPVGNLYETPLISLWNSPKAIALRSKIIDGKYESAGCAKLWCSWREGKKSDQPEKVAIRDLINEFRRLTGQVIEIHEVPAEMPGNDLMPKCVQRMLTERNQRIAELEAQFVALCEKNRVMLEMADKQNQLLASRALELERTLHLTSGNDVPLITTVRFGSSRLSKILKKFFIGAAIRSIQLLDRIVKALKRFVNWLCRV